MKWLARHLDWVFVGVALILSVVWIGNYIVHPMADQSGVTIVDDHYVPSLLRTAEMQPIMACMKECNNFCFFPRYHRLKVAKGDAVSQVADADVGFQEFFTHVSTTGTCASRE